MPNDQYGRPVSVGDTVIMKGEVVKVLDDPGYVNCTVKLATPMPPAGTEVNVQCNTAQVENQTPPKRGDGEPKGGHPPQAQPQGAATKK